MYINNIKKLYWQWPRQGTWQRSAKEKLPHLKKQTYFNQYAIFELNF